VADRAVHDFGAGDLELSHRIVELGATKLIAIDRHDMPTPTSAAIERQKAYYENIRDQAADVDVALLSWPVNWPCCLEPFVEAARVVIYLGKCTDGSMCAYPGLWAALTGREVLAHVPDRSNTLIVYGPAKRPGRRLLPEEYAGVHHEHMWSYDEIMLAMIATRYDRMLDESYAAKPSGPTPLPEMDTLWELADKPGFWRVIKIDYEEGVVKMDHQVTIVTDPMGSFRNVRWWTEERDDWSPVV
jgi:hypothetical protein